MNVCKYIWKFQCQMNIYAKHSYVTHSLFISLFWISIICRLYVWYKLSMNVSKIHLKVSYSDCENSSFTV